MEVLKVRIEYVGVVPLPRFIASQLLPVTVADQAVAGKELVMLKVWDAGLNPAIALRLTCCGLMNSDETVNDQTLPVLVALKPMTSTRQ